MKKEIYQKFVLKPISVLQAILLGLVLVFVSLISQTAHANLLSDWNDAQKILNNSTKNAVKDSAKKTSRAVRKTEEKIRNAIKKAHSLLDNTNSNVFKTIRKKSQWQLIMLTI